MAILDMFKAWVTALIGVGLSLIALAIVWGLLVGSAVPFLGSAVAANIVALVKELSDGGLVGLIAALIILNLISSAKPAK